VFEVDLPPQNLIYALIDPRTKNSLGGGRRYVGQSIRGMDRPIEHKHKTADNDDTHRANWLRSVWSAGLDYEIEVLQYLRDDQPYDDIDNVETWWIAYGRSEGWDLTNYTDGGGGVRGYRHTKQTRSRISEAMKTRWQDPEHSV